MSQDERCPECSGHRGLRRMVDMMSDTPHECTNAFHDEVPVAEVVEFPGPAQPAEPEQAAPKSTIPKPVCPYCLAEGKIFGQSTTLGPIQIMVVRCGNNECRKILGIFQPLMFEQQQMMPPGRPV